MRIVLLPVGSSGDVHPLVGIGLALQRRGHEVTLITNGYFRPLAERVGLPFRELGSAERYIQIQLNPDLWHPTKALKTIFGQYMPELVRKQYDILAEYAGTDAVVLAGSLAMGARVAQEKLGIRLVTVHLQPAVLRSFVSPPMQGPLKLPGWWPRWMTRTYFSLIDRFLVDPIIGPAVEPLRQELGLPKVRGYFGPWWNSPLRVLALFPEWFAPAPDYPPQLRFAGFPLYDERTSETLTDDVRRFLDEGDKPIVATFGSGMRLGEAYFAAVADACRLLNRRGILLTPFRHQIPASLPANVRHIDYVPFGLLLPHAAALVHHGGIGTCAQGMAAGVPQIVMPLAHDQPDNALRLRRLGVGWSLKPKKFTGPALAKLLEELWQDPRTKPACLEIAGRLREEKAVEKACRIIEDVAATVR
jgi:UDP:flavonoid glycosyltransferase YjiC (YdhE family)